MKITNIRTLLLSRWHEPENQWFTARFRTVRADCPIVVIETDDGLQGIGEPCAYGGLSMIRDWVNWLKPEIIGRDPRTPGLIPAPNGHSRAFDCAVAGLDCALWDLRGKIEGKRTADLLKPGALNAVRLYASSGCRYDWRERPEQLIEETLGYLESGFTATKVRIGTEWAWDGVTTDRFIGLMRELAQAVNGRMELMLDGNQRLTEDQALPIAREIDHLGFVWFEEPIPMADVDGYARLNAAVDMPITGGEQYTTVEQFRPYLEKKAYSIVQPDAGWCGITEAMRIAEVAHRYGVDLCPHSWHNGLMALANGHLVAALPNPRVLEFCMIQGPLQWEIFADKPAIANGCLELPNKPGFGMTLADNLE
ncbi:MAG: mandelate racemase/muconate lactonizing enzyme family protein, partial [Anaerolineae bacterium]|nr:mandelate racemase/muconate lactonizing enzyme family protein [Anaerolineae bacterium]